MLNLTIAIPAKNEEARILECLDAIGKGFAKSIVVIDSGSTDRTVEIAGGWGAEVIDFRWNGMFPKKRNWYLRNHRPMTEWVLFLDADELLTENFKAELRARLPTSTLSGFWLQFSIHFLGKPLKYGYPLEKIALFRVGAAEYEHIDEDNWSSLDMEIHEHPIVNGPVGRIRSKICHREDKNLEHYISKHNEYSSWEAKRVASISFKEGASKFTWRQRIKHRVVKSPFAGIVYFIGAYVLMLGFLDGARGLAFATLKSAYFMQVYCKIRESQGRNKLTTSGVSERDLHV